MNPVQVTISSGSCPNKLHEAGQVFKIGRTMQGGMCLGLWNAIAPYVTTLRYGGNFPWEKEKGVLIIRCPDPKGIVVELRRIEEEPV